MVAEPAPTNPAGDDVLAPLDALRAALRTVIDPEVGMNIVDLGLVYDLSLLEDTVRVDLTMTSPACPMGELIVDEARAALARVQPAATIVIHLVWEPPWDPSRISEGARARLGW